jgi:hypothetical protein
VRAVRRRSDRVMSAASRSRADTVEQGLGDAVGLFEGGKVARKGERVRLRVSNGVSYPRNEQFSSKQATLYAYLQGFCEKPSGRTRTVDPLLTMEVPMRYWRTRPGTRGQVCPANCPFSLCLECPRVPARVQTDVPVWYPRGVVR